PRILNLKKLLTLFLEHRRNVVLRRTAYDLKRAEERAHILEGLKIAVENLDEIINLIKSSGSPEEAKLGLMKNYPLSEIQAQAILDMKLQRLTALERDKILSEFEETQKEIRTLKEILGSEKLVRSIIRQELLEVKERYGDPRRTDIVEETGELKIEDLITEEDNVITISHLGYIKRNPLSQYRSQRRGGKGLTGMETKEEDYVTDLYIGSTHDYILFFTNKGRLYWLKVYQIPEAGRYSKGKAIVNLLPLEGDEKIATALATRLDKEGYIVMFTKKGLVKKTDLREFSNPRSKGVIAINLEEDDELIAVKQTDGKSDLIIGTKKGLSIRFKEEEVRPVGRVAKGVIGIRLLKDDEVVSADTAEEGTTLLTVTEKGLGKRTEIKEYPVQGRGGKGVISIKTTSKGGNAVGLLQVRDEDEIVIITNSGKVIRTKANNIPIQGRSTQGVKLMDLEEGDRIVGIGKVAEKEDSEVE
ncbi:MAG: DNA gyrase C-terminal beta-propeller domain-containing protein, partial [Thermodesulfovibrionales bacterium]